MSPAQSCSWGRWTLLVTVILVLLVHTELSAAKALSGQDGYWSTLGDVSKRNTWWSKKSYEPETDSRSLQASPPGSQDGSSGDLDLDKISALYGCYVQSCMPQFVLCAKRSRDGRDFRRCKAVHRACAAGCYLGIPSQTRALLGEPNDMN